MHQPFYLVIKLVVNLVISILTELECSFLWQLLNHILAILNVKAYTQCKEIFEIPQRVSFYDYKLLGIKNDTEPMLTMTIDSSVGS